jgi:hypothetical protein
MNESKSLIPPTFVNVASEPVYDAGLPDALFRTYIRLRGLAWQSKYRETPPLRVEELAEICHHNVRSMWGHLSALRDRGLVTWHTVQGRMVFDLQPLQNFAADREAGVTVPDPADQEQQDPSVLQNFAVDSPSLQKIAVEDPQLLQKFAVNPSVLQNFAVESSLQNFAVDHDDGIAAATDSPGQEQQQQPPLLQKFAVNPPSLQNFAVNERVAANLAALAAYGVDVEEATAQETARLDHVTPDMVRTWGEHLRGRPCRNLPGLLLYKLRTTQNPPRTGERRGGNRQETAVAGSSQDALPIPESAEQPECEVVTVDLLAGLLKRQQARGDRDAVGLLLEDFGIVAPASSQVIARFPDPDDVRGWMLYALCQPGLDGKAQGYVVNRLLAGETPPGRFRHWAQMEPEEWQALWHTCQYGTPGRYGAAYADEACVAAIELAAWREDFAGVFRRGPFGDEEIAIPKAESAQDSADREEESPQSVMWKAALAELQLQMTQATFDTWLKGSELVRCEGDTFVVGVASDYAKDWLENRLLPVIARTLARLNGCPVNVAFVTAEEART